MGERPYYLVNISVRQRLFWCLVCGLMSYDLLGRWSENLIVTALGIALAVLCVLAFIAAMQLLWLKTTLIFWH